jgi:hypothetical protein
VMTAGMEEQRIRIRQGIDTPRHPLHGSSRHTGFDGPAGDTASRKELVVPTPPMTASASITLCMSACCPYNGPRAPGLRGHVDNGLAP